MSFKTMLAVIGVAQTNRDLQVAAEISDQVGAHLSALIVGFAPQPTGRYATRAPAWFEQRERNLQALDESARTAREQLSERGISFDVDSIYAEVAEADYDIGERAIYCDLVLICPDVFEDADLKRQVLGGGLFQSGRPVLLIPRGTKPTLHPKTIVLAWDSQSQSAHAARAAEVGDAQSPPSDQRRADGLEVLGLHAARPDIENAHALAKLVGAPIGCAERSAARYGGVSSMGGRSTSSIALASTIT